jgi:hypothetical protein
VGCKRAAEGTKVFGEVYKLRRRRKLGEEGETAAGRKRIILEMGVPQGVDPICARTHHTVPAVAPYRRHGGSPIAPRWRARLTVFALALGSARLLVE